MSQEIVGDGAEVGVVRAHDDGHGKLRGLEGVVATGGDKAPADESYRRKRIDRGKLADGVEKDDLACGERLQCVGRQRPPIGSLDPGNAGAIKQCRDGGESLRMARGEDESKLRVGFEQARPGFEQRGLFALERAAGD